MSLIRLDFDNVRNLHTQSLNTKADCLIFTGQNGSGKTSILEAIYLLGRGTSFRSKKLDTVVAHQAREMICFGEIFQTDNNNLIGLSRNRDARLTRVKVNGRPAQNLSEIASLFPLLLVTPHTFKLVEGNPKERRSFLDWGVFHVEPSYKMVWQRWHKSLLQRNKLLKNDNIDVLELRSWDEGFCELSHQVSIFRRKYFDLLTEKFRELMLDAVKENAGLEVARFVRELNEEVEFSLDQGWAESKNLREHLIDSFESDRKLGSTRYGPHRADIKIRTHGFAASEVLSRGQLKFLISNLLLAQLRMLKEKENRSCTLLIDDIGAELDIGNQFGLLENALREKAQVFVTVLDDKQAEKIFSHMNKNYETKMFHVKHGRINPL